MERRTGITGHRPKRREEEEDSFVRLAREWDIRLHTFVYTTPSYCSVAEVVALSRR